MFAATPSKVRLRPPFIITALVFSLVPAVLRAERPNLPLVDAHRNETINAIADSSCVPACNGACVSLKAVAINSIAITPNNCIHAHPGDTISTEIKISGWAGQLELVNGYQSRISGNLGAISGSSGTLLPVGWDAPINLVPCTSFADCSPEFPICGFEGNGICIGLAHNPDLGAFITLNRPDYVLFGFTPLGGIRLVSLDYIYAMTIFEIGGAFDNGNIFYGGTLNLIASADACGTFTYAINNQPNHSGDIDTFLIDQTPQHNSVVPDTQPLIVSICTDDGIYCNGQESCDPVIGCVITPVNCDDGVACTVDTCNEPAHGCDHTPSDVLCDDGESCTTDTCTATGCVHQNICGSCCDQRDGACTDGVLATDCTCALCQWTQGEECANADCHAQFIPIPTISSWGATILVLILLTGAKIRFSRRLADSGDR